MTSFTKSNIKIESPVGGRGPIVTDINVDNTYVEASGEAESVDLIGEAPVSTTQDGGKSSYKESFSKGFKAGFNDFFDDAKPLVVYDSFHGEENKAGSKMFKDLIDPFEKRMNNTVRGLVEESDGDLNENLKKSLSDVNKEANDWSKKQEDLFKEKAGNSYDKDYKVGSNWKYDSIDFYKKNLWNKSGSLYDDEVTKSGIFGSYGTRVRVGTAQTSGTIRVGPDHVVLDASASIDGIKAEAAYHSPALVTKDGLELLSYSASGEISVLHAEAKAKAGVGHWTDEEGKSHLEAGVQLKAEADLVKASATGKWVVNGVGVQGNVGVKVGVGAQLDAGLVDGELKVNLSVAAGLGLEVGFSVDLSGVFDQLSNMDKSKADFMGAFG